MCVQFAAFLMLVFMLEAVVGVVAYLYEFGVRFFCGFNQCFDFPLSDLTLLGPVRASGAEVFFVRIGPVRFLAGCRKRRLNQG